MKNVSQKESQNKQEIGCTARNSIGFLAFLGISGIAALVYFLITH